MNLRIGDICVINRNCTVKDLIGLECTITGEEDWRFSTDRLGPWFCFEIDLQGYGLARCERCVLTPRRPPSWDKWITDTSNVRDEALSELGEPA